MKFKNVKRLLVLAMLSMLVIGCGKGKGKGAGKKDLDDLIETYRIENQMLAKELEQRNKELEIKTVRLIELSSNKTLDAETIDRLLKLVGGKGVTVNPKGVIVLDNSVTFTAGSDKISSSGKSLLRKLVNSGVLNEGTVYVMGHTDKDPISRTKNKHTSNFELSAKRAAHVVETLQSLGVSGKRLVVMGYGEFQPIPGAPKNKQRRIGIKIEK